MSEQAAALARRMAVAVVDAWETDETPDLHEGLQRAMIDAAEEVRLAYNEALGHRMWTPRLRRAVSSLTVRSEAWRDTAPSQGPAVAAESALTAARARVEEMERALRQITEIEREPYMFPADWREQIAACSECERFKTHPIQQGICDTHRKPLWARERHDNHEQRALIYRAKDIARNALARPAEKEKPRG